MRYKTTLKKKESSLLDSRNVATPARDTWLDLSVNHFNTGRSRTRKIAWSFAYRVVPLLLLDRLEIGLGPALAQYGLSTLKFTHDDISTVENAIIVHIQSTECVKRGTNILL